MARKTEPRWINWAFTAFRACGVKLGNPNGAVALRTAVSANAAAHAPDLARVLADIRASGAKSLRAMAMQLNARRMMTWRGRAWQVSTVRNLLRRFG